MRSCLAYMAIKKHAKWITAHIFSTTKGGIVEVREFFCSG